jgi:hypothetical protein
MQIIPYEQYENKKGVRLSFLVSDDEKKHPNSLCLLSYDAYKKRSKRSKGFRLKEECGQGNKALIARDCMPLEWQEECRKQQSGIQQRYNPPEKFFRIDPRANAYYDAFGHAQHTLPGTVKRIRLRYDGFCW